MASCSECRYLTFMNIFINKGIKTIYYSQNCQYCIKYSNFKKF